MSSTTAVRDEFLLSMGRISAFWGFNKAMGQIYALLYLSPEPVSLGDIAASLSMSKGNVSLNARSLERWGLIRQINQKSDRRDYYEAELDFWKIIKDILRERDKKEFDQALATVSACLEDVKRIGGVSPTDETRFLEERFLNMQEFFTALDTMAKAVLVLDKLHLTDLTGINLGKKVSGKKPRRHKK